MEQLNKYKINKLNNTNKGLYQIQGANLGGSTKKLLFIDAMTDKEYMFKIPKEDYITGSGYNDHIAEFLGSNIIQYLGYPSQNVFLANYDGIEGVIVEMFGQELVELSSNVDYFYSMEYRSLDLDKITGNYKLRSTKDNIDIDLFNKFLIKMLIVDYIIINIDRHPGNIGFILNKNNIYEPSPFYDSGASFLTRYFNHDYNNIVKNHSIISYKIIKDGKRCKFSDILESLSENIGNSDYYKEQIEYIIGNYNRNKSEIYKIIDTIGLTDNMNSNIIMNIKELLQFTTSELETLILNKSQTNSVENIFKWNE